MEKIVTAKNVAELAGVSISAVSRTFTEGASASQKTRNKVLAAAESLGYQPNLLARSLITGRTELIGLVSNNFHNPAYMEIFNLFTLGLQKHGFRPLLINLSGDEEANKAVATLQQYNVDAIIVASSTLPPDLLKKSMKLQVPIVHAFGKTQPKSNIQVVGADNYQGGRLAANLLIERNYRKIAFLGGPQEASSTKDRLKGFREELKFNGFDLSLEIFGKTYSHDVGRDLMHTILQAHSIDAVFCGDDILAIGAIDACYEAKVSVPEQVGVIGFNDIAMASWSAYKLTTIRQPIGDIIVAAVNQAINLINNPKIASSKIIFPCEALIRKTLRNV